MFEKFEVQFIPENEPAESSNVPTTASLNDFRLGELITLYGGKSFNNGIYRILPFQELSQWDGLVESAFPSFAGRLTCFAIDWLGRIFTLDAGRLENGHPGVLLLEPGTAEALEIPCDIESFHEKELIKYREEALAESFYRQWLDQGGMPPQVSQCVGYKRPLFLGGSDTVNNLVISDLDVYWTISAQLIRKTRGLPPEANFG